MVFSHRISAAGGGLGRVRTAAASNTRQRRSARIFFVFIAFSVAALINILTFESISSASPNVAKTIITATKQYKKEKKHLLYCHLSERQQKEKVKNFLCEGWTESNRLIQVNESYIHEPEVIWVTSEFKDIAPLVKTSMQIRLKRRGLNINSTLSPEEIDNVDPNWKIFFYDISDNGIGNGWLWNINKH